jgi:putative phosphoesterase
VKIAIISDIHSNIYALESVLKDIQQRKCDTVLCLGDCVGYYYWPDMVINVLKKVDNILIIQGNHEEMLFLSLKDSKFKDKVRKKYGKGIDYACNSISAINLDFLEKLPKKRSLLLGGKKIGVFHGSPNSTEQYIYPDVNQKTLTDIVDNKFDVMLFGHTHHQFISYFNSTLIINPGSVGQARDVRGLAAYSIYDTDSGSVLPLRLKYNSKSVVQKINEVENGDVKMISAIQGKEV